MLDKILGFRESQPSPISSGFLSRVRASSGINVDEDTALTYSAVFSAVKVISETVAILPWRPYDTAGGKRKLLSGSALDVLLHRQPNGEMTAFSFREFLIASSLLHGNGYAEIEQDLTGAPVALHPIHPSSVEVTRDDNGLLVYRVKSARGEPVDLRPARVFHVRGPTKDGVVGRSVLALARESWGLGIAAEQFAGAFFGNGAIPSLFIEQGDAAPALSKEGAQNMLESFERRHKGAGRAGRAAYLEKGFTVKTIGIPQKDAQFVETRKFGVSDVARWFRIPPHKIGDLERAAFANIESQERNFVNDAVMPWLVRLEQEASVKLVTQDGVSTKLDVRGLLRGTNEERANYYAKMRDLGVLSVNEIRELEDLDPIDGGELRLVPLNMVSLQRASQSGGTDPASAVRGVVIDAHERMMRKESLAFERAKDGGKDLLAWANDFYSRHTQQMVDALIPSARALAESVGTDAAVVSGIVVSHVRMHCEASISAAVSGHPKIPHDAETQSDRLIGLVIGACNV